MPSAQAFTGPTCTAPSNCAILTASGTYLGVGTTSPAVPLDVNGIAFFGSGAVRVGLGGNISAGIAIYNDGSNNRVNFSGTGNVAYNYGYASAKSFNWYLSSNTTAGVTFATTGYVGIATTTPGYPLSVNGNIFSSGSLIGTLSGALSAANITSDVFGRLQGNGNFAFPANLGVATSSQNGLPQTLSVYGGGYFSGNVGIGTTGPVDKLQVNDGNIILSQTAETASGVGQIEWQQVAGQPAKLHPALKFINNPTADSYGYGTNLAFWTYNATVSGGDAERMRITSAGNVGIGTTAPVSQLEIGNRGPYTNQAAAFTAYAGSLSTSTGSYTYPAEFITNASNAMRLQIAGYRMFNPLNTWAGAGFRIQTAVDNSYTDGSLAYIYIGAGNGYNGAISLGTGGIDRLFVNSNGNVGVGTTTTTYPLTVNGQIASISGGYVFPDGSVQTTAFAGGTQTTNAAYVTAGTFGSSATSSNSQYYIQPYTNTTATFGVKTSTGGSVLDVDTSNQRVGIGTASPAANFDVVGGPGIGFPATSGTSQPNASARFENSNTNVVLDMGVNTSYGTWFQTTNKTDLSLEYPILLNPNGGNVGIGTTGPALPLEVSGVAALPPSSGTAPTGMIAITQTNGGGVAGYLGINPTSPYGLWLQSSNRQGLQSNYPLLLNPNGGNVGIGTTTPAYPLTVNGVIYSATGGVRFPDGSVQTVAYLGSSQQTNAAYVTQGTFGSSVPGSNNQYVVKPTTNTTAAFQVQSSAGTSTLDVDTSNIRVGIGTASPGHTLQVNGDLQIGPNNTALSAGGSGPVFANVSGFGLQISTLKFGVAAGNGTTPNFVIDSSGQVGIGTASPGAKLDIASTTPGTYTEVIGNQNYLGFRRGDGGVVGTVGMMPNDWFLVGMPTSSAAGNTLNINYSYNLIFSHKGTQTAMFTGTNGDRFILGTTDNGSDMLQVNGTSYFGNQVTINGTLNMGTNSISMNSASSSITVNKLNVNTIDPLYDIGGVKYATYGSAIAGGVKEEYVGQAQLVSSSKYLVDGIQNTKYGIPNTTYSYTLDFNTVAKGSDLWVWRQAVDFSSSTVNVLATPIGTPVPIAYQIEGNKIVFTAIPNTAYQIPNTIDFSYRLVGSRFDWQEHPTLAPDQTVPTSLIIK